MRAALRGLIAWALALAAAAAAAGANPDVLIVRDDAELLAVLQRGQWQGQGQGCHKRVELPCGAVVQLGPAWGELRLSGPVRMDCNLTVASASPDCWPMLDLAWAHGKLW